MRRLLIVVALAGALSTAGTAGASAESTGAGSSADAPGQVVARDRCTTVWTEIQAEIRALGGPKAGASEGPIGSYPDGSGPTNCDHFWQLQEEISN